MKKILFVHIFLLCVCFTAFSQPYYFRHYQVENGLSHNTIFSSVQDKNGFLWFGSKDGLNRFDGYRFKRYTIHHEENGRLKQNLILSLATDANGTLWVGTQRGLFYLNAKKETFVPFLDSLHGINDIFFDSKGHLWYIANFTANRYNVSTGQTTTFPADWFFKATTICQTTDGTVWIATNDGFLQRYNEKEQSFKSYSLFSHSPPAESNVVQKIIGSKNGSILIGTNNQGIKEFYPDKGDYKDILTYNPDKTTIYVRDILQVSNDQTWFATESGIFIYTHATGQFQNLKKKALDPYSLSDNAVYTLYKDTEGGIWAGTFFGGLNYFPKQTIAFQKFFPDYSKNSISGNAVREICEDNEGNIWIGTEDAGLNKLSPQTGTFQHFSPTGKKASISYYNIHGLLATGNELWIGTFEHGLNIMDIATGTVKKLYTAGTGANQLKNGFIVSLLKTRRGQTFVGTALGLYQYTANNDGFRYLNDVADGSFISALLEDHQGTIWIGTHNRGLYYLNPSTGARGHFANEPGNVKSLSINSINSLFEDSEKNLWLSMEGGGLSRLDRATNQFVRYTTKNGLPSNFVFKVLEDDNKTLWITTSKGLVNLDPGSGKLKIFTKENGLINDQFNYNSGYKDRQGNLYFGSVQGLIKFNPASFRSDVYLPPVYITGLQVQNKEIDVTSEDSLLTQSLLYTKKIVLPYHQSSFSIDFAALRFTSPETTEYSYIMSGLDNEWTHLASNRKVYFTNVKPGKYTFKVKAGKNGIWNEPVSMSFVITPPFWATPWAYMLYALAVLTLLYYLIKSYHQIQENKKAKEIYQAKMDFFTNIAHEIKTPLTLIKGPVENLYEMVEQVPQIKEDVNTMDRNTDRLIKLINQILDFRQTETKGFSLDFGEVNVKELLKEAYLTFEPLAKKKGLQYTLELPAADLLIRADAEALTKVFDNLFSNAVKYSHKEVQASVHFARDENMFVFQISNDGYLIPEETREKIFEPFFRIKETAKQKGTGLGLALARSLVDLHEGKLYVKTGVRDRNTFVVEIPLSSLPPLNQTKTEKTRTIA